MPAGPRRSEQPIKLVRQQSAVLQPYGTDLHLMEFEREAMDSVKIPKLSIGLPVYNGERHLRRAIDSHLAQSFTDFELIICDNASTDRTEEICRYYASMDERVRYYRHATNTGAVWNFNHCFEIARGKYFKWSSHDDFL